MASSDGGFEFRGINHLALVCRDMERTVDFYTNVLGMPLIKTIELPAGMGQHFFFDCGGGDCPGLLLVPRRPSAGPGNLGPGRPARPGQSHQRRGSMNHVAFSVPAERIDEYRDRLRAAGVDCTDVANHDDSEWGIADELHPGVFVRSDLLPGSRRHPARVRLLDADVRRGATSPRPGPGGRPGPGLSVRCPDCGRCRGPKPRPPS